MMSQAPDPVFSLGKEEREALALIGLPYSRGFKNITKKHINASIPSDRIILPQN